MSRDRRRVLYVATPEDLAAQRKFKLDKIAAKVRKPRKVRSQQVLGAATQKSKVQVDEPPRRRRQLVIVLPDPSPKKPRERRQGKSPNAVPRGSLEDILRTMEERARSQRRSPR